MDNLGSLSNHCSTNLHLLKYGVACAKEATILCKDREVGSIPTGSTQAVCCKRKALAGTGTAHGL